MKLLSRILKRCGAKATAWDQEFKTEFWDQATTDDPIYPVLQKYPGSVLEIGCGSGMTPAEMHFTAYTGVDFSKQAIAKARGKNPQHQFHVSDMNVFVPMRKYNVILFRESLYYAERVSELLNRLSPYLEPGGVFIARICSRDRHCGMIAKIHQEFDVKEAIRLETGGLIMVFAGQSA